LQSPTRRALGLPYAFASHFTPDALFDALEIYRKQFKPSAQHKSPQRLNPSNPQGPYAMVGVNVVAADTDEEARCLFTTTQQSFTNLLRGSPGQL